MTTWNTLYKRVRASHAMSYRDVARCCALGGLTITRSRAEGWSRTPADTRRYVVMSGSEFDAFTSGLPAWARESYQAD